MVTASWTLARGGAYWARVMVLDVVPDSIRPSSVQMARAALQSVVSGRVIVMSALPFGLTVMVQP